MRKPVFPNLENHNDLTKGAVPVWLYKIPEPTDSELAAVRSKCPDDILEILGMTR